MVEKSWLDRFLGVACEQRTPPRILDLGCGFGDPVASYLSAKGSTVTGVDSSLELLQTAKMRAPNTEWIEADMRQLNLGRKFDGVLAWNSLFHLTYEDQRKMFPIFRAHSVKGAALLFTSGTDHGEAIGEFAGEPLYHASLAEGDYRKLLSENGFDVLEYVKEDPLCHQQTIWLARCIV